MPVILFISKFISCCEWKPNTMNDTKGFFAMQNPFKGNEEKNHILASVSFWNYRIFPQREGLAPTQVWIKHSSEHRDLHLGPLRYLTSNASLKQEVAKNQQEVQLIGFSWEQPAHWEKKGKVRRKWSTGAHRTLFAAGKFEWMLSWTTTAWIQHSDTFGHSVILHNKFL